MLNDLKKRFYHFMEGRYGSDDLTRFLALAVLAMIIISFIFRSRVWFWLEVLLIVVIYFRQFSKNLTRRYLENEAYLRLSRAFSQWLRRTFDFKGSKSGRQNKKSGYMIFTCPSCGQKIRIPKGHGKVSIHCSSCGNDFIGNT